MLPVIYTSLMQSSVLCCDRHDQGQSNKRRVGIFRFCWKAKGSTGEVILTMLWGICLVLYLVLKDWASEYSSSSSSSSRNEYYLGGIIALLLQDHRTMSIKSVCSSQYILTDQHWATGAQIKHSTLSDRIRERRPEQNGLQFSAEDGRRRRVSNVLR